MKPLKKNVTPMLTVASLALGATTAMSRALDLRNHKSASLTLRATQHGASTAGYRMHIYTSADGVNYDTIEWGGPLIVPVNAGVADQKTISLSPDVNFIKVTVENDDGAQVVTNITVLGTRGEGS